MAALIQAAREEDFPAEIAVVISNRSDAGGLEKARASGVPTVTIESKPFGKDRSAFEIAVQSALDQHKIDLICLGGFMRLFTAEFVQRWYGRMLNIHPSLLPSFPGLDPQGQAIGNALKGLGFAGIGEVRQGKLIELELAEADPVLARARVEEMCRQLLANPVIEDYAIELVPLP